MKKKMCKVLALLLVVAALCSMMIPAAFAATAYPALSSSKYAEFIAQGEIKAYSDAACQKRGTVSPYKLYNAYADKGDKCQLEGFTNNGKTAIFSYPTASGSKRAYTPVSNILPSSSASDSFIIKNGTGRITTWMFPGQQSYGWTGDGERVYLTGKTSGNYTQIIYPGAGGIYKLAWVSTSALNAARPAVGVNPKGFVDRIEALPAPGTFRIVGWCFDSDAANQSLEIHVYVGGPAGSAGAKCYGVSATAYRPDVRRAYPSLVSTDQTGFDKTFTIDGLQGNVPVYIYAINKGGGQNVLIGSKTIYVQGKSTAAATSSGWQMPMNNAYCTWRSYSNMSWNSYTIRSGDRDYHLGIDIYGTNGTVYAAASGKVVAASSSNSGANGRYIILQHSVDGKTVYSFYAHLSSLNVSVGQTVNKGAKIGVAGGSGDGKDQNYGTHLHFAITDTLWAKGSYYGYAPAKAFSGNKAYYENVTYYNPVYVVNNNRLP